MKQKSEKILSQHKSGNKNSYLNDLFEDSFEATNVLFKVWSYDEGYGMASIYYDQNTKSEFLQA